MSDSGRESGNFGVKVFALFDDVRAQLPRSEDVMPPSLKSAHARRQGEWLLSRWALIEAFRQAGVSVAWSELRHMDLKTIPSLPEWVFSISHSENAALVWLTQSSANSSIGVDLERADRPISDALASRLKAVGDQTEFLSDIEVWSLKEAAFKTLNPAQQKNLALPMIQISTTEFSALDRNARGSLLLEKNATWIMSFAWRSV